MSDSTPPSREPPSAAVDSPWSSGRTAERSPASHAVEAAAPDNSSPGARRITDLVTVFLLVAAAAAVGAAALPSVLHGLSPEPPAGARPGIGEAMRAQGYISLARGDVAGADGDGDGSTRPWDPLRAGPHAGRSGPPADQLERRAREAMQQRGLIDSDDDAGALPPWGVTVGPTVLRTQPNESAEAVEQLVEGETLIVVRGQDDWLLVAHRQNEEITMGWVERGKLLLPRLSR